MQAMEGVGSTADNLKAAVDAETYEYKTMYPPMIKQAQAEGHRGKRMFEYAAKAESVHAKLYAMALEAAKCGSDLSSDAFYLCPVCGNVEIGAAPASCPICGTKGDRFIKM